MNLRDVTGPQQGSRIAVSGHKKSPKAGGVRQAGISPSTLIAHLQKIATPPALLHEPSTK